MKSFDLQEIYTMTKKVDGKQLTIGIKFIFHGETEPISYGSFDGTSMERALFKSSEIVSAIKYSGDKAHDGSKYRLITFFDKDGNQIEGWKHSNGITYESKMSIFSEFFASSFEGEEVKVPEGHQIVGFAIKQDVKGNFLWVDLKT